MQTRRFIAVAGSLLALAAHIAVAEPKSSDPESLQFYGKLTNVNVADNNITVHNKKSNKDGTFQLSADTRITDKKQNISPKELQVGQFLVVYYVSENDISHARRISVRPPPFKKMKQD